MALRTRTPSLQNCGLPAFTFAGFAFPRYLGTLPVGPLAARLQDRHRGCTGDYYHAPSPDNRSGRGFYLGTKACGLRWHYADDIVQSLRPGYYCDLHGDQTIRGIVLRLPRGRGFLAGWTMGEEMASAVDYSPIFDNAEDAAFCADSMAENAAENEREHQERMRDEDEAAELEESEV